MKITIVTNSNTTIVYTVTESENTENKFSLFLVKSNSGQLQIKTKEPRKGRKPNLHLKI